MKCMVIVGTRPEFVQVSPLIKLLHKEEELVFVNTGQHYDTNMADVFFDELHLPKPDINLGVGSLSTHEQIATIITGLEPILKDVNPDWVVVFGDTNSTVAAALAASHLHIPIAHIEAGLRSFDRRMPEEINRVVTDHISSVFFAPTQTAVNNLRDEGIRDQVYLCGDVRVDLLTEIAAGNSERLEGLLPRLGLSPHLHYALATIHRPGNTDVHHRLAGLVDCFNNSPLEIILPAHPRLTKMLEDSELTLTDNVHLIPPVGILDMVALIVGSQVVITDSGGLQKEAYLLSRPAITLRENTEWIETIESDWNRLCEPEKASFFSALEEATSSLPDTHPDHYGKPGVCRKILTTLQNSLQEVRLETTG